MSDDYWPIYMRVFIHFAAIIDLNEPREGSDDTSLALGDWILHPEGAPGRFVGGMQSSAK